MSPWVNNPFRNPPRRPTKPKPPAMWQAGWGMPQAVAVGPKGPKGPKAPGGQPTTSAAPSGGLPAGVPPEASAAQSAADVFRAYFAALGMPWDAELEGVLFGAMRNGYGPDQIELILPDIQSTTAFKRRFPGYQQRIANGYNAISLGEYLTLENDYHRRLQNAGLPAGFYDDPSDFGNFIANDVSPDEFQNRINLAVDAAKKIDPTMRNLMSRFYGLGTGEVASYFLDPTRALSTIEHQYKTAEVASWASRNGYTISDIRRYERLTTDGVTAEQAAQGYGTVKALDDSVGRIAGIYGESYGQDDAEQDVFFNKNEKRRRIMAQEVATYSGSSRGATGSAQRQSY